MGKSEKKSKRKRHRSPSQSSDDDSDEISRKRVKRHSQERVRKHTPERVRKHTPEKVKGSGRKIKILTSSTSSSSSDSSTESDSHRRSRKKKKEKKTKWKEKKIKQKKKKKHKKHEKKKREKEKRKYVEVSILPDIGPMPVKSDEKDEAPARIMKPMTKEQWEKQRSLLRRVHDPATGRDRIVRGDGEIVEEIVSKERQKDINKKATMEDGRIYQQMSGLV